MSKFKVGDKVRVKTFDKRPGTWNSEGKMDKWMGKVVTIMSVSGFAQESYSIIEDPKWLFSGDHLEPIDPVREFIVLRRDGQNVIASHKRGDEIVKTAKATCNPVDTFDFETGATLAFDRLMVRSIKMPCSGGGTVSFKPKAEYIPKLHDRVKSPADNGIVVWVRATNAVVLHDTWNRGINFSESLPGLRLTGNRSELYSFSQLTPIKE